MATSGSRLATARAHSLSTRELITEIAGTASLLVKKEIELARSEVKADIQSELAMAKALIVGGVVAVLGINALLMAVVFALATLMPAWLAAVITGGALLIVAAVICAMAWSRRVTSPLAVTRRTLKESVRWARERWA